MLSYRHAGYAGNHGDILKHVVLTLCVEYLQRKDNGFVYIDTHAGAGRYDLQSQGAQKNRKFESGILRLWQRSDLPKELRSYIGLVRQINPSGELRWYPGSPWLVRQLIRYQDIALLFELQSHEVRCLQDWFTNERNIKIANTDGLQALNAILPPTKHYALVLVDPSYEMKKDFKLGVSAVKAAYHRFTTGVYLLWYPVTQREYIDRLENGMRNSGIPNILSAELTVASDRGMSGSGMIILNPPTVLKEQLRAILPYLARQLGRQNKGNYRIEMLASE
jgi:23S rRNA (adenine2030-N6)-methyltransferase